MLTVKSTFKLFDVVNKHFHNDDDSRLFIAEVEEIMDNKVDLKMNDFATRKDLAEHRATTKQDFLELKLGLEKDFLELKSGLEKDFLGLKSGLEKDFLGLKSEVSGLRFKLEHDISGLRSEFKQLDASINLNLSNTAIILERTQKEHLKWMMGFVIAMLCIAVAVIKLTA